MMNRITIGSAREEECQELSEVITAVIGAIPYYNDIAKRDEIKKFTAGELKQKIKGDALSVIVARVNHRPVGFCLSRFDDYTVWLEWFGVVQEHRGKSIADLLLNGLAETVAPRRCHKIWCDCRTANNAAIHILTAHGYKQLATVSNHWYGQDFILWERIFDGTEMFSTSE